MEENLILVENKEKREELINHLEALDKVKTLAFITKDNVVTTDQVANYFEVNVNTIKQVVSRHKEELESNGLKTIRGQELKDFKTSLSELQDVTSFKRVSALTLFTKRAVLNVGMLLTESLVAEKVRDYLLNIEDKATNEQKEEAFEETVEKTAEKLDIKLLKTQNREAVKLVKVQAAMRKLEEFGLSTNQASLVVQRAVVEKVNVDKAILAEMEKRMNLEKTIQRGIIREKISYVAKHYYDNDYETVYHLMSDKMRYQIGFNMRAHRERLKAKNAKAERGCKIDVPSYLDIIVEYQAYDSASNAINEIMDEKEQFKVAAQEARKATKAAKNAKNKEEEKVKPKEAKTEDFTF